MKKSFVIVISIGVHWKYFRSPINEKEMYNHDSLWIHDVYGSSIFDSIEQAEDKLNEGRKKYHWGGIFSIQPIYISA